MIDELSAALAQHLAGTSFAQLPANAIDAAKESLIDTFACALAGRGAPGTDGVLAVCRTGQAQGRSRVWSSGETLPGRQAAFANSVFAAALDYDSVFHDGVVHSDIVVVPTAVAMAETLGCSGDALLAAIALGNDVLCRLSLATRGQRKGWFFTSIYGVLVSAGVTARMLGGDARRVADAMGLALFYAGGTYQAMTEQSMSKRLSAAFAVDAGIHCGHLAMAGCEGVQAPLLGAQGLFAMYQQGDPAAVVERLGEQYLGTRIGRKPYPSCQCNHAPIEAALQLRREHAIDSAQVHDVDVFLSPHACRVVGSTPTTTAYSQTAAQFSVQYSLAAALLRGRFGIGEIQPPALADPHITALAERVRVIEDSGNPQTYVPATVRIRLRNGTEFTRVSHANRGAADLPLSRDEMRDKFRDCLLSSDPDLSDLAIAGCFDALLYIDQADDVSAALSALDVLWRPTITSR